VRLFDPENRVTRINFFNSENLGSSRNGKLKKEEEEEPGRFSEPAPKTGTDGSHKK
jgi:hypothetical protein